MWQGWLFRSKPGINCHDKQRAVGKQFFIAGVGYIAINGGSTIIAGGSRAVDPFVELTIADRRDPQLQACRALLVPASFVNYAVRLGGSGHLAVLPSVYQRQLAVLRLEKVSACTLVSRR